MLINVVSKEKEYFEDSIINRDIMAYYQSIDKVEHDTGLKVQLIEIP